MNKISNRDWLMDSEYILLIKYLDVNHEILLFSVSQFIRYDMNMKKMNKHMVVTSIGNNHQL